MASEEKIQLRLDLSVPFEREFARAYRETSRSRRQEWMRLILRLGLQAFKVSEQAGSVDLSLLVGVSAGHTAGAAPVPSAAQPEAPAPADAPTPPAAEPPMTFTPVEATDSSGESAVALKGFFPDIGG